MAKYQDFLSRVGSNRDRAALRGIFSMFLTDDNPPALKDLVLASIVLSGAETTQITISGASTTGILQSGTSTTAYSITGAFTTGISIAADGTTAIAVTSAFTGVTGLSFAGTASGDGILISGACADGIHISGTNTASGLHISGDQVSHILLDVDAAADNVISVSVDDGITATVGINIARTGTTGICTTGIMIDTDGTTALWIGAGFTGVTGVLIAGTASGDGISITGVCADGIHISGNMTASGLHISGDQVVGTLFEATAAADAAHRVTIPTGITLGAGLDINATSTGTVTSGLTMQGTGTFTTGITLSATAITTGITISAGSMTDAIKISGTTPVDGIEISSACSANGINLSGNNIVGLLVSNGSIGVTASRAIKVSTSQAAAAMDDGYGIVEIDHTITGTAGSNFSGCGLSSWVNIPTGTVGSGKYVCAQNNGVYEAAAATITGARIIFGMRAQKLLDDTDAYSFPFSVNTNNTAITAVFDVNNATDMGWIDGVLSSATGDGHIPLFRDNAGVVHYVNTYTA